MNDISQSYDVSQSYDNIPEMTNSSRIEETKIEYNQKNLQAIVQKYLDRTSTEDIDFIESIGGESSLITGLNINLDTGIPPEECEIRREQYGENSFLTAPDTSFLSIFGSSLAEDNTLKLLVFLTVTYMFLGFFLETSARMQPVTEGATILLLLCLYNLLPSIVEYLKAIEVRNVSKICASLKKSLVLRNGKWTLCHPAELVVGDIVRIYPGSVIEADGLVLQAHDLRLDESDLTGETELQIKKRTRDCIIQRNYLRNKGIMLQRHQIFSPILMSGSFVQQGEGKYLVLNVGQNSVASKFIGVNSADEEQGPLQAKLEKLMVHVGRLVFFAMVGTFSALIIRWGVAALMYGKENFIMQLLDYLIFAMIAIIFFIPSDLASSATATMINITRKLRKNKVFVKKINIYEKFDELSELCMGKTGKITKDQPTLTKLWNHSGIDLPSASQPLDKVFTEPAQRLFTEALACNNSADVDSRSGYPLDLAILQYLKEINIDYQAYQHKHLNSETGTCVYVPFSHTRRRSTIVLENVENLTQLRKRIHTKGAPEEIIKSCDSIYDFQAEEIIPLDETIISEINAAVSTFSCQGLRPLALAYKEVNSENDIAMDRPSGDGVYPFESSGLTLIGILAFTDKLKVNVVPVIAKLKSKGIRFTMVTGDGRQVSKVFAKEVRIIGDEDENNSIYEGESFQDYIGGDIQASMSKFVRIKDNLKLIARAQPKDKEDVVKGLLHCCENNAAENQRRMVGTFGKTLSDYRMMQPGVAVVAMGNTSCEIVKNRADVIFLDDELSRLVGLVSWSRHFEISLKQVIQFQLATIFSIALFVALSCLFFRDPILTPVQWLWLSLVVLILSIGLGQEHPRGEGSMRETRRSECDDTGFIDPYLKGFIYLNGFYSVIVYLLLLVAGPVFIPEYLPDTEAAISFVHPKTQETVTLHESVIYNGKSFIRSGRRFFITGAKDYERFISEFGYSRHYTILFTAMVLMQIITVINARCVKRERNMFEEFTKSKYLLTAVGSVFVLQFFGVSFGGRLFGVSSHGMHIVHWFIVWIVCSCSFLVNFLYKQHLILKLKTTSGQIPGTEGVSVDYSVAPDTQKSRVEMAKSFDMEA